MRISLRDPMFNDFYTFELVRVRRWHWLLTGVSTYDIVVVTCPKSQGTFAGGPPSNGLDKRNRIVFPKGVARPKSREEAVSVASVWTFAYVFYCRKIPLESAEADVIRRNYGNRVQAARRAS